MTPKSSPQNHPNREDQSVTSEKTYQRGGEKKECQAPMQSPERSNKTKASQSSISFLKIQMTIYMIEQQANQP